jgi:site-specific DNA recombinase
VEELEKCGCEVIFLERPIQDNPEDRLLLEIRGAFSEYERAKLMERARLGKLRKARAGQIMNVRAPYGYRYIRKRDGVPPMVVVDEAEAEVVRQIFSWYIEEGSVRGIARRLTKRRIPTKFGRDRWPRCSIYCILKNEAYIGTLYFNRTGYAPPERSSFPIPGINPRGKRKKIQRSREEWIAVSIPAILDKETFQKAQRRLERNKQFAPRNNKQYSYLLKGLVKCGLCGGAMTGMARKGHPYYRCKGKQPEDQQKRKRCSSRMVRTDELDQLVWGVIAKLLEEPEVVKGIFKQVRQAELEGDGPLQERMKGTEQLIERSRAQIQRLIDAYAAGVIELGELRERREGLEARIDHLRCEMAELKEQQRKRIEEGEVLESLEAFRRAVGEGLEELKPMERQQLVRLLIEEVEVKGNDVQIKHIIPITSGVHLNLTRYDELDQLLTSLPGWGLMKVDVTPLQSFKGRIAIARRMLEWFKAATK